MKKRIWAGILTMALAVNLGGFAAAAAEPATEPTGIKLDARYYTQMPEFGRKHSDLSLLNDEKKEEMVIFTNPDFSEEEWEATKDTYIDIDFNGNISVLQSFYMICETGWIYKQSPIKFKVLPFDPQTQAFAEDGEEVTIDWSIDLGDNRTGAVAILQKPVRAGRVRILFTEVATRYGSFRMGEFAAYGENAVEKVLNLAERGNVTVDFPLVAGSTADLKDTYVGSEIRSEFMPTAETPATIELTLDKAYDLTYMELFGLFAKDAGLKTYDVFYKDQDTWVKLGDTITRTRGIGSSSSNTEYDTIPLNVTTDGVRIVVEDVYKGWGHFRLSDIILRTNTVSGSRIEAQAYTPMQIYNNGYNEVEKLTDGKYHEAMIFDIPDQKPSETTYIDLAASGNTAEFTSFELACNKGLQPNQSILKFKVLPFDEETGAYAQDGEEVSVNWLVDLGDDIKGFAVLKTPVTANSVRLQLTDLAATWGTIRVQELAPYGKVIGKAQNIVNDAKVSVDFPITRGSLENLTDTAWATEIECNVQPTAEKPAVVTMEFDIARELTYAQIVGKYAKDAGITNMDVEYRENNVWKPLKNYIFTRPALNGAYFSEIDTIDLGVKTDGLRFIIRDVNFSWGHFRLSDIILKGKELVPVSFTLEQPVVEDNILKVNITAAGDTNYGKLVYALYSGDRLQDVKILPYTGTADDQYRAEFDIAGMENLRVSAYIWDGMTPLCEKDTRIVE